MRSCCRSRITRATKGSVHSDCTASFPADDGVDAKNDPSNRTRPLCNDSLARGHVHPGCGIRGGLFRSTASDAISPALYRADADPNPAKKRIRAVVPFIQDRAASLNYTMLIIDAIL